MESDEESGLWTLQESIDDRMLSPNTNGLDIVNVIPT